MLAVTQLDGFAAGAVDVALKATALGSAFDAVNDAQVSLTTAAAVAAGESIIVLQVNAQSQAAAPPTDAAGNFYAKFTEIMSGGTVSVSFASRIASALASGSALNGNYVANGQPKMVAAVKVDRPVSPVPNAAATASGSTATPTATTAASVPKGAIVVAAQFHDGGTTMTLPAGWTPLFNQSVGNYVLAAAYKVTDAAGVVTYAATAGADDPWLVAIAAFQINDNPDALTLLTALGETSGLQFVLDAGHAKSMAGNAHSQWRDLSANGQDFWMGTLAAADAADPTRNGTLWGLSAAEYWSFDGGDWLTYDAANEPWMVAGHKEGAALTLIFMVYPAINGVTGQMLCGTMAGFQTGFRLRISPSGRLSWQVTNAGVTVRDADTGSGSLVTPNAWNFCAVSINENGGAGSQIIQINDTPSIGDAAYTNPSALAPTATMQIGAAGNGADPLLAGTRLGVAIALNRGMSLASLAAVRAGLRSRFG
jgi:hypothetical protein